MQAITIETRFGPTEIKAVTLNNLCAHKSLSCPGTWDITHTASSMRVGWLFKTRRDAVEAARAIDTKIAWAEALSAHEKGNYGALGAIRGRLCETFAALGFPNGHC